VFLMSRNRGLLPAGRHASPEEETVCLFEPEDLGGTDRLRQQGLKAVPEPDSKK
jgi:hypothetical protein